MRLKNDARERFRENICRVLNPWSMFDDERARFNVRANEMIMDVNMFGLAMVGVIDREGLGTIVVGGNDEGRRTINMELIKGLSKPDSFLNGTREGNVLSFCGGESHTVLLLR